MRPAPGPRCENLALLCATIPPGARVLEFGCGTDSYASELVERGYRVTAIPSESDLLNLGFELPVDEIDGAICLQLPNWNQDADVIRLLQEIRAKLTGHGIIILACQRRPAATDLETLVRAAGFEIARSPSLAWIVASPVPVTPAGLALHSHCGHTKCALDLRWSPDEVDYLAPTLGQIWAPLLSNGVIEVARDYALHDPWGGLRAASAISSFFGLSIAPENIVFGAGVTGLLRQFAPLVRAGRLLTTSLVHRDFPLWAVAEGAHLHWITDERDVNCVCTAIEAVAPQVLYLDRPSATGHIMDLESLTRICLQARRFRGFVMIDEAYLSYFAGDGSAVALTPTVENLIVMRSLSKGYCAGGLRVGFAAGGTLAAKVMRRLSAPLQVSELAFQMGLRLLEAGDVLVHLRARIAEAKCEVIQSLTRGNLPVIAGNACMPWVLIDDPSGDVQTSLAGRGIAGKRLVPFMTTPHIGYLRLAVPLSAARLERFRQLMGTAP